MAAWPVVTLSRGLLGGAVGPGLPTAAAAAAAAVAEAPDVPVAGGDAGPGTGVLAVTGVAAADAGGGLVWEVAAAAGATSMGLVTAAVVAVVGPGVIGGADGALTGGAVDPGVTVNECSVPFSLRAPVWSRATTAMKFTPGGESGIVTCSWNAGPVAVPSSGPETAFQCSSTGPSGKPLPLASTTDPGGPLLGWNVNWLGAVTHAHAKLAPPSTTATMAKPARAMRRRICIRDPI